MAEPPGGIGTVSLTDRRVLVVDDDPTVSEVVTEYLRAAGFVVDHAAESHYRIQTVQVRRPPRRPL